MGQGEIEGRREDSDHQLDLAAGVLLPQVRHLKPLGLRTDPAGRVHVLVADLDGFGGERRPDAVIGPDRSPDCRPCLPGK